MLLYKIIEKGNGCRLLGIYELEGEANKALENLKADGRDVYIEEIQALGKMDFYDSNVKIKKSDTPDIYFVYISGEYVGTFNRYSARRMFYSEIAEVELLADIGLLGLVPYRIKYYESEHEFYRITRVVT